MDMERVRIGVGRLTGKGEIYLYYASKRDPRVALHRRKAEKEFFAVLVEHMFAGMSEDAKGVEKEFWFGDQKYLLRLTKVDRWPAEIEEEAQADEEKGVCDAEAERAS